MSKLPLGPPKNDPQCLTVDVVSGLAGAADDVGPDDPPAAGPDVAAPDAAGPDDAEQPAVTSAAAATHRPIRTNGSFGRAKRDGSCISGTPGTIVAFPSEDSRRPAAGLAVA
jgi:hypothetical protein